MNGGALVIGLELHVQLATRTKMFCGCEAEYGAPPNSRICPVCLGMPGALPVANARAVELGSLAALSFGCTVHPESRFARKAYFYPDLPRGYQITQLDAPLATDGSLVLPRRDGGRTVRIRRVHLEEDTGRSLHAGTPGETLLDFNRAGIPLIEIVTEPDIHAPEEAAALVRAVKQRLEYLGVSDCDMEKGSLRVDANLSLRTPEGDRGEPCEIKNLNSISRLQRALAHEAARQQSLIAGGMRPVRETRFWDEDARESRALRSKEGEGEYRFFPEPDLPPLRLSADWIAAVAASAGEDPERRLERMARDYELPESQGRALTARRERADRFEALVAEGVPPRSAASWLLREEREVGGDAERIAVADLARLIRAESSGPLTRARAREIHREVSGRRVTVEAALRDALAEGRSDDAEVARVVAEVLAERTAEVERYGAGEQKLLGFFMGEVLRRLGRRGEPRAVEQALREALLRRSGS